MPDEKDAKAKEQLENILSGLDKSEPSGASPFTFLSGAPKPKTQAAPEPTKASEPSAPQSAPPPALQPVPSGPAQAAATSEIADRLRRLEQELSREKEKALRAEILLRERENARLEMESLFKSLKDQSLKERTDREMDAERQNARARVEVLEKRLTEMNVMFMEALREHKDGPAGETSREKVEEILSREKEMEERLEKRTEELDRLREQILALTMEKNAETARLQQSLISALREKDEQTALHRVEFFEGLRGKDAELQRLRDDFFEMSRQKDDKISKLQIQLNETLKNGEMHAALKYQPVVDDLQKQILQKNRELLELATVQEQYDKLKKAHDDLKALVGEDHSPLRNLVRSLRSEVEIQEREIQSLRSALQDAQHRAEQLLSDRKFLMQRLDELEKSRPVSGSAETPGALESLRDALAKKERELEEMEQKLRPTDPPTPPE